MKYLIIVIFVSFFSCKGKVDKSIEVSSIDSFELLANKELQSKSLEELRFIRNEVYARKGHVFKDKSLNDHYASKKWYTPKANAKIVLSTTEEEYVKKIKDLEKSITENQSLLTLPTVNLEKERKSYENKGFKIVEEVKGLYNNDLITDVVWVINKMTRPKEGGTAKMEYWLQVFLGTSVDTEYKSLFKSDKVIPCNNCYNWQNKSDHSYYDINLKNKKISFYTNQWTQDVGSDIKFDFEFVNGSMILNQIKKKQVLFKENEREEEETIKPSKTVRLQNFNVYDWKYVDPGMLSG